MARSFAVPLWCTCELYGRSIHRLRVSFLPDTGLHGVAAAHEGPEELVRVLCRGANYVAIH